MGVPGQAGAATEPPARGGRSRLLFAGALAGLLVVAVIVLVVFSGGGQEHEFVDAPERCLDGWNEDPTAPSQLGVHQYDAHGYNYVQVLMLSSDGAGAAAEGEPGAVCGVLFASNTLDAEAVAAALIQLPAGWQPLSKLQPTDRLAEYQSQAQREYNAELQSDGTIEPL